LLYSPSLGLGRFSVSWSYAQAAGFLGRGSDRCKASTNTQNKRTLYKHPYLEWDWNPRSQCSNYWIKFLP
jgi:hypothetical protein